MSIEKAHRWITRLAVIVAAATLLGGCGSAQYTVEENPESVFAPAIVVGSSVSMGFWSPSPPVVAARQAGVPADRIHKKTNVSPCMSHYKWLASTIEADTPKLVFGLDLFYHDIRKADAFTDDNAADFTRVLDLLCETGAQVYVGTVFTRFRDNDAAARANEFLMAEAERRPNLHVMPVDAIYTAMYSPEGFTYDIDGVRLQVRKKDYLLDPVHPNRQGSYVLANTIIELLKQNDAFTPQQRDAIEYMPLDVE